MSDIVDRCRDRMVCSPPQNSCRNDFALEQAADRIEELEAQLAAMTAERDAAILRAYAMALEAAAVLMDNFTQADHVAQDIKNGIFPQQSPKREAMASSIRALTPPADLVDRVLKGGE